MVLNEFIFPSQSTEEDFLNSVFNTAPSIFRDNVYPWKTIVPKISSLDFAPITILYGSNGSGKSTVLNVISEKLNLKRNSDYNRTYWMDRFISFCICRFEESAATSKSFGASGLLELNYDTNVICSMITSDDIFKYMLDERKENLSKIEQSFKVMDEINNVRLSTYEETGIMRNLDLNNKKNLREFFMYHKMKTKSTSSILKSAIGEIPIGMSNGENALNYLIDKITDGKLLLLDEPENSMASEFQERLANYIKTSAEEFGTQFIIATHSPFILAIPGAKIYDLDEEDYVREKNWWELKNMQVLFNLFDRYRENFVPEIM